MANRQSVIEFFDIVVDRSGSVLGRYLRPLRCDGCQVARYPRTQVEQDMNDLLDCKESIVCEIQTELELLEEIQQMVINFKKQINDQRKEKEKIQIQVK